MVWRSELLEGFSACVLFASTLCAIEDQQCWSAVLGSKQPSTRACGSQRPRGFGPGFARGAEVEDGDGFRFNADFNAPLYRVKINAIQLKETQAGTLQFST